VRRERMPQGVTGRGVGDLRGTRNSVEAENRVETSELHTRQRTQVGHSGVVDHDGVALQRMILMRDPTTERLRGCQVLCAEIVAQQHNPT